MALVADNRLGTFIGRRSRVELIPVQYTARLPSRLDGAWFRADILVLGAPGQADPVIDARVYERMVATARTVSERYSVLDDTEACYAVKIALSDDCPLADLQVQVEVVHVDLMPWPGAAELASAHEQLAAQTALARERHKAQAQQLSLFRDYVLSSPGLARLWWVSNDPERLVQLAEMKEGVFEKCVALLAETGPDRSAADQIAAIIESFLRDLGPEHRALLLTQIGHVLDGYERADLTDQLTSVQLESPPWSSAPAQASWPGSPAAAPGQFESQRFAPDQHESDQYATGQPESGQPDPGQPDPGQFAAGPFSPPQFSPQQFGSPQFGAQQFGAQQFGAQQFGAQQFGSPPLDRAGRPADPVLSAATGEDWGPEDWPAAPSGDETGR